MKNIHVLPTNKPSRVFNTNKGEYYFREHYVPDTIQTCKNYNIYITYDEEIKERDWVIAIEGIWKNTITKITGTPITDVWRKIILTTDYDIIAEGVQPIDNEFLEWFVKNPSCERVEVVKGKMQLNDDGQEYGFPDMSLYKIIIPQEEPKQIKCYCGHTITCDCEPLQETIEEAAKKLYPITGEYFDKEFYMVKRLAFIEGAKWQSERMYSEEDLHNAFYNGWLYRGENYSFPKAKKEWFKQFKKK